MADNVTTDPGALGAVFRTDEDGGSIHWPYTKIAFGADNTQTIVGSISSNPLPVALSATDNAVLDTIESNQLADGHNVTVDNASIVVTATNLDCQSGGADMATAAGQLADGHNVTIDNAAAGAAVNIQDGGNTITVDGTVTANPASGTIDTVTNVAQFAGTAISIGTGARDAGTQRVTIATDDAVPVTHGALTELAAAINTNELDINIASDSVGIGGGTQYTEDAVAAADPVGNAQILVRDDSPVSIAADGDNVARRCTAYGAAYTQVVDSSGSFVDAFGGGTQYTEDVATANPIVGTATMMERDDALGGLTPAEGDWAALRCDANGALWTSVDNTVTVQATNLDCQSGGADMATAAGQLADGHNVTVDNASGGSAVNIQDGGNSITVDGAVTVSATNLDCQSGGADMATAAGQLADGHNVTIDNASGGSAVNIQDGGNTITVDGAVTADLGANNDVTISAAGTGGMSYTMLGIAAADNDVVIKASAATVYFISIQSIDATPVYLKLFNLASFTPGTSSATLQYMCPANATAANGAGIVLNFGAQGIQFGTGLCALIATGFALDDNTAVSANEVVVTIGWE